jgi:hypothetical protein
MDSYTIAFGIRNVTHRDIALQEAYRVRNICRCVSVDASFGMEFSVRPIRVEGGYSVAQMRRCAMSAQSARLNQTLISCAPKHVAHGLQRQVLRARFVHLSGCTAPGRDVVGRHDPDQAASTEYGHLLQSALVTLQ